MTPGRRTLGSAQQKKLAARVWISQVQRGCTGFDGDTGVQVACRVPTGSLKGGKNTTADTELALAA